MSHPRSRAVRPLAFLSGGLSVLLAASCANSTRPPDVPGTASFETGGRDKIVYIAPTSGTLYISDQDNNALVYSGPVLAGDRVVVDPDRNRVAIDDQIVVSQNVNHDDHRIYLLRGAVPSSPPVLSAASLNIPRPVDVTPTAVLGAEGRDRLEYTPAESGVVWVVDASRNVVVYRARVMRGDRTVVDPSRNSLSINGTRVFDGNLPAANYRIFFSPGPLAPVVVAPQVVAVPVESPAIVGTQLPAVPSTAVVLSESTALGTITATQSGTVWITDTITGRVVFTGHMLQGDTLVIDPTTSRITLNANRVEGTAPGHYRVSFMSGT